MHCNIKVQNNIHRDHGMNSEGITDGNRGENEENGNIIAAVNEQNSEESLLATTDSSMSTVSEMTDTDQLEETVVEVRPVEEEPEEPDYKGMYEEYKKLLEEKTEKLRSEMCALGDEHKRRNEELNQLREAYQKLEIDKENFEKELKVKEKQLETLKAKSGKTEATQLHLNRKADELFKSKSRKKSASNISITPNKCEYNGCCTEDADLVKCSICSKYVCETCNEIPVGKLKAIVKICNRVYFLCKMCHQKCDEIEIESLMADVQLDEGGNEKCCLQEDLEVKRTIIARMEQAQKTFNDLVSDKDEMIENQKMIINKFQADNDSDTTAADLKEVRDIVSIKEAELSSCQDEVRRLKLKISQSENSGSDNLKNQLQSTLEANDALDKKLLNQIAITKKTEHALETQQKLTASKVDLIENLKQLMISQSQPSCPSRKEGNNLTSSTDRSTEKLDDDKKNIPGMEECLLCLSNVAIHGVILDGLLLWVDTQRRTIASDLWKEETIRHFTPEEITSAKNRLWDVCDENIIGKLVKRQGPTKQQNEIDDIANALEKLVDKQKMPIFVATSYMVHGSPKSIRTNTADSIQNIEEIVDGAIKKRTDLLDKKHDRTISKTDYGNKKMEEVLKRLDLLEKNLCRNRNSQPGKPILWNPHTSEYIPLNQSHDETKTPQTFVNQGNSGQSCWEDGTNGRTKELSQQPLANMNNQYLQNQTAQSIKPGNSRVPLANQTHFVPTYAEITKNGASEIQQEPRGWKQKLHLLNGAHGGVGAGSSFAADVDIVAYNVATNICSMDLTYWLSQNGINVKDCKLLTTSENARSLAYKITIDPKDYEKATTDASIWPYQVGVRQYKHFNTAARSNTEQNNNVHSEYSRYNERKTGYQGNSRSNDRRNEFQGNGTVRRDSNSRFDRQSRY